MRKLQRIIGETCSNDGFFLTSKHTPSVLALRFLGLWGLLGFDCRFTAILLLRQCFFFSKNEKRVVGIGSMVYAKTADAFDFYLALLRSLSVNTIRWAV